MFNQKGFLEFVKNYSMTGTDNSAQQEIGKHVCSVSYLTYRWVNYQYWLDAGNVDKKLTNQQPEFLKDIEEAAIALAASESFEKPGDFACDVMGMAASNFAYMYTNGKKKEGVEYSREEEGEIYRSIYKYFMDSAPAKAVMKHLSGSQETTDDYMRMRAHQHSNAANVLKTLLIDYALDTDMQGRAVNWEPQFNDACIYLFFFDCNSDWTSLAVKWILMSSFSYDMKSDKTDKEAVLNKIFGLVDGMIDKGEKLMRSSEKLVGQALLDKVRSIPKNDRWLLAVQCGYTMGIDEDGETLADTEGFKAAYLAVAEKTEESSSDMYTRICQKYRDANMHAGEISAQFIDKIVAFYIISNLEGYHKRVAEAENTTDPAAWQSDARKLSNIKDQLARIEIGDNDFLTEVAESLNPTKSEGIVKPESVHITLSDEVRNESFVKGLSEESIEVIEHFGPEAAHLLNKYSCSLEDALMVLVNQLKEKDAKIEDLEENAAAMNKMLTDPETLRKYTDQFFGPDGAYPNYQLKD